MPVEVATAVGTTTMEITISKFELLRELTATQGVVERKTTIPILSNYLFEASTDKLSLTATDLDLSLRTSCTAKVKKEGSCTIPARKLYDYVKLLPDADITIKLLENHWVSIRCGRSNTKMVGMARANFPSLPAFPTAGVVKIPAQVLRSMIAKTNFAISNEESRYTLNGGLMVLKPESITMVATDGHRLAHVERPGEKFEGVSGEMKTLVPKKAMDELKTLLDSTDAETIDFAKDESTLFFRIGQRLLTSRQLTGQFPNYEAVLPKEITKSVTVQGDELGSAIARVAQFADERSRAVRLKLEKGELKLSASSTEAGESEDSIEISYNGDPLTIGFNAQYLVEFIKASGAGEIKLEFKDPQSAGQMRPADSEDYKYRYIVMPMRI
ncbi:MAG TPA: DNA polymerase III subunit beta [Terriglobales bacterium]|jgi:DNA polymerase III subunit beta|nr:DNA polymerase III subunit beta [Terriglobales bacterium]